MKLTPLRNYKSRSESSIKAVKPQGSAAPYKNWNFTRVKQKFLLISTPCNKLSGNLNFKWSPGAESSRYWYWLDFLSLTVLMSSATPDSLSKRPLSLLNVMLPPKTLPSYISVSLSACPLRYSRTLSLITVIRIWLRKSNGLLLKWHNSV
jgi:hypothetical protein